MISAVFTLTKTDYVDFSMWQTMYRPKPPSGTRNIVAFIYFYIQNVVLLSKADLCVFLVGPLFSSFSASFSNNDKCSENGLYAIMEARLRVLEVLLLFPEVT